MADRKTTELQPATSPQGADLLYLVQNVSGTPTSKSVTVTVLFGNINTNVQVNASNEVRHIDHFVSANNQVEFLAPVEIDDLTLTTVQAAPTNSNDITAPRGKIWFDSDYLYITTDTNFVKRVALTDF